MPTHTHTHTPMTRACLSPSGWRDNDLEFGQTDRQSEIERERKPTYWGWAVEQDGPSGTVAVESKFWQMLITREVRIYDHYSTSWEWLRV